MSAQEKQGTVPEYPASTINMDYSSQIPGPATAPGFHSNLEAVPYTVQTEGNYLNQAAGLNPTVFPPPPPYNELGNQPQTVIVQQPVFKIQLTDKPGLAVCPACNVPCTTNVEHTSGSLTILLCVLLFFIGGLLGCFLIPCCVKSCKDVNHYCPNCKNLIYKYKRL